AAAIAREADRVGLAVRRVDDWPVEGSEAIPVLDPGDEVEPVEIGAIRRAVEACLRGEARALVTGPIHKARLAARGFRYAGHTDFLGHLTGCEGPVMAFVGGRLKVALVTVHLPL